MMVYAAPSQFLGGAIATICFLNPKTIPCNNTHPAWVCVYVHV